MAQGKTRAASLGITYGGGMCPSPLSRFIPPCVVRFELWGDHLQIAGEDRIANIYISIAVVAWILSLTATTLGQRPRPSRHLCSNIMLKTGKKLDMLSRDSIGRGLVQYWSWTVDILHLLSVPACMLCIEH